MEVHGIVAMDMLHGIGKDGGIPWHLPEDLRRFKRLTMGHPVVMGRVTHESIGRKLPGRRNLVLTSNRDYVAADGCEVIHSLGDAWRLEEEGVERLFIIGGEELYYLASGVIDVWHLTMVQRLYRCDRVLPVTFWEGWEWADDPEYGPGCVYLTLRRVRS